MGETASHLLPLNLGFFLPLPSRVRVFLPQELDSRPQLRIPPTRPFFASVDCAMTDLNEAVMLSA